MAMLKFRKLTLEEWLLLEEKDNNTRYTVFNEDGSIYGEYIGDVEVVDISNKLDAENPDFTGIMYYEGEEALKIVKALQGMGCTINTTGNDTEEKCIAAGGRWVEANIANGDNIFIGPNAGNVNVGQGKVWVYQGTGNYAFGAGALKSLSLGKFNIAIGPSALGANTEGDFNIAIGRSALLRNSTGKHLIAIGDSAFFAAINQMIEGVAIGYQAFGQASQGAENVALGYQAGLRTEGGSYVTNVNKGVFLGGRTRAKNSTSNNEIVIGNRAVGNGDNTVTVGNDEIEKTYLKGDVYLQEDKKVKSNAIPTDEEDLVNKEYVDTKIQSKYNFIDFVEGSGVFNIDTDCNERTIYINISSLGLGTFPSGYSDGGFLIQTWEGTGEERKAQMLFDPRGGKIYSRVQVGDEVWGEWKDHTSGKQDKLIAGDNITIDPDTNVISSRYDEPDGVTILLNEEGKLEVSKDLVIDGGFL